jgi:hypothetical protein
MSHKEIDVIFINAETGQAFARSSVPADQLPKSFEAKTTFHLQDGDWEVVEARPMTAQRFIERGSLILRLRKVVTSYAPPKIFSILYLLLVEKLLLFLKNLPN